MNKNFIREKNISQIKTLLFKNRSLFASELVHLTHLSIVTINSLLKELIEKEFVVEEPAVQREFGRPAAKYHFNYDRLKFLLVSIEATQGTLMLNAYIVNLDEKVLKRRTYDFSACTPQLFQTIMIELVSKYPDVEEIAISIPGKVDQGTIRSSWNEKFDQWNIKELMESITNLPYQVQNDVHLLTIGHCLFEKLSLESSFVGIYFPPDSMPGISIFIKNALIEGNHALAGEAKYFPNFRTNGIPKDSQSLVERVSELIVFYNVALAPSDFILAIPAGIKKEVSQVLEQNEAFQSHPNECELHFIDDFETCILYGLQWLILRTSPYDLTRNQSN